ncbi:hypothetical protein JHK87_020682 [Glycine soja]|nr:hypothetical protein JHK87_020682 [Glycine soja]
MSFTFTTMTLNLVLLMAMVATNILSLYHLSSTLQSPKSPKPPPPVPDQLLHQLHTIRATINHCGRAVNRWIPLTVMEFLLLDVDRVLRGGGYLWVDHFFSKGVDLEKVYAPLIGKLGYKKVKWATGNKTDAGGVKNGEVYLTALLQKPVSR